MLIRYGYDIEVLCLQPTPLITLLDLSPGARSRAIVTKSMTARSLNDGGLLDVGDVYCDSFDNVCRRITAPSGGVCFSTRGLFYDSGLPDNQRPGAIAHRPDELPAETIAFVLGSRYCETDKLSDFAWSKFSGMRDGWATVSAICDYVHETIRFDYKLARSTRTAAEALDERVGVCRDFTHTAIALCRCMNIPARYCTGYLGDIGVPRDPSPMDFSAWFEVYLEGAWWSFDARHNTPRIGRIVMARGRDAADVPFVTSFGPHNLGRFEIVTEEESGAIEDAGILERLRAVA